MKNHSNDIKISIFVMKYPSYHVHLYFTLYESDIDIVISTSNHMD